MLTNSISIAGRTIGTTHPPFVIAEISANHNCSLERALSLIDLAATCGVSAVKLQTFTPDSLTLNLEHPDFQVSDPSSPWFGRSLYSLYTEATTPWEWHQALFDHAHNKGIICLSSPFDEVAVDRLESIGCPAYKIASFELTHIPLIQYAASTGKPLIISTGMASFKEIQAAVDAAQHAGCNSIALLKCTSSYPAAPLNANISTISHLKQSFSCPVGISDHTAGIGVSIAAVSHGASIIEKHFTDDRSLGGLDSSFSLEPSELSSLQTESLRAWQAQGHISYEPTSSETSNILFRRSIYVSANILAGDVITSSNIRIIRPALGLSPSLFHTVIGMVAKKDLCVGTPLSLDDLIPS